MDQSPKKDIVVQSDWNSKPGKDESKNWEGICDQYCNPETKERGLSLLEIASYNNLKEMNKSAPYKPSKGWTLDRQGGEYHSQIDYIMVKRRFQSRPGAFQEPTSGATMSL